MVDYPFYDKQPGPERREKLNELYATWENAISNVIKGDSGWSPLIRAVSDSNRVVLELYDWTGGQGSKPAMTGYLGSTGYVSNISLAIDFRGPIGTQGNPGPANTLSIGTVSSGTNASATITGTAPSQALSLVLPKGDTGAQGPKGDIGETGPQGLKGDKGDKGDVGDTGPAATIAVGTVTTGAPGTAVEVDNAGTPEAAVFNFVIPRGADGVGTGDVKGPSSAVANQLAQFDGTTGKLVKAVDLTGVVKLANGVPSVATASDIEITNYPTIRPSLMMDFVNSKSVDPRITFTRASTATYYDGKTVAKAEENLLIYSQEFDRAAWTKNSIGIGGSTTAPDGSSTGLLIIPTTTSTQHLLASNATVLPAGSTITSSFFAKAEGYRFAQLAWPGGSLSGAPRVNFDVLSGVISAADAGVVATITPVGGGWHRCIATVTLIAGVSMNVGVNIVSSASSPRAENWSGDGTSGIYIWGAQLEQRSTATAYTPTTDQPITRYQPVLMTAPANVPRIDYDPVTGECKGLLIEGSRTNLLTYSEFQAGLSGNVSGGVREIYNMYGFVSGVRVGRDASVASYIYKTQSVTLGTVYTFSFFIKMEDYSEPSITQTNTSGDFSVVCEGVLPGVANISKAALGNGTYRVSATYTSVAGSTHTWGVLKGTTQSVKSFVVSGYQLEAGAFPTSYIPTTTSQVTRAADNASMTGENFSSWYKAGEGTFVADGRSVGGKPVNMLWGLGSGNGNNRLNIYINSTGGAQVSLRTGNTIPVYAAFFQAPASSGVNMRLGLAMSSTDISISKDGATAVATNVATLPELPFNNLRIGSSTAGLGDEYLSGHIKRITYYPKRLPDAQLQALTA